ncbi:MAG: prepilin-type N-terminal cleavage/methylation domain-containing protein [Candidatus Omnitrophica bacterium]|nr:prepilin-type N-terminal cleavage/methylation domain-containing protein [Candidatus Omnitrophota bacterium]
MRVRHKLGFTMIELIIAIVLLGITMIPLGLMSIEFVKAIPYSRDLGIAQELAKTEMAKINNLSYSDSTLDDGYDNTASNYEGYLYDLRRTVNYVSGWNNNLKEVQVRVYPSGVTVNPLTNLLAYVADVSFGAGSSGGAVAGGEADSLVVFGGSISGSDLQNITLENTSSDPITITGVRISFSGGGGIKLNTITMDSTERWSGTASSGTTITLDTSFALSGSTTYSNTGFFSFSKSLSSVSSLVFIMGDASETESYPW